MKIENKTRLWVEQGIITEDQAQAIHEFEESSGRTRWSHLGLYAFVILGVCVLAIGIISLVATNWETIPEAFKLAAAFAGLAALGAGIHGAQTRQRDILHDVLSALFVLWCLATIGLISQVFHTGGALYQALAFWLVIVLPLSYMGKRGFLPAMWAAGLVITFWAWALDRDSWWAGHFLAHRGYLDGDNIYPMFMITALWGIFLGGIAARFGGLARFGSHLWSWGIAAGLAAVFAGDIHWSFRESVGANALYPAYLLLPLAVAAVIAHQDMTRAAKGSLAAFLVLSLAIYLPALVLAPDYRYGHGNEAFEILGAAYSIISAAVLALYFAARRRRWLFHAMTVAIGIRFLIIYLQVFEDLAYTGIGLIVSGLVIIGLATAWYKLRARLEGWAKGLVS